LKNAWDKKKGTKANMAELGLSLNPNESIPIVNTRYAPKPAKEETKKGKKKTQNRSIVQELEAEASMSQKKIEVLSEPESLFCITLMKQYGEDYVAMAKDYRNYYQETPKQIRKKIMQFKKSQVNYAEYLDSKQEETN
ncbi:hypothetical protein CAPTEDRAFT_93331, partial [Capitella teleta]